MKIHGTIWWILGGSALLVLLLGAASCGIVQNARQESLDSAQTRVGSAREASAATPDASRLEERPRLATAMSTRAVPPQSSPAPGNPTAAPTVVLQTTVPTAVPTAVASAIPTAAPDTTDSREPRLLSRLDNALPELDDATEIAIGQEVALELEAEYGLYTDPAAQQRVEAIGQRIVPFSDRPELPYHFALLDTDEVNAFAVPGGFIYVTRGMLEVADATTDDELAGVIGHEIAHVAQRHGAKQIERVTLATAALEAVAARNQNWERIYRTRGSQIAQQVARELLERGWSRQQEFDADYHGTLYMMDAGYDPYAIIALFERMEQLFEQEDPGRGQRLLATHPPFDERIARIETVILENQ